MAYIRAWSYVTTGKDTFNVHGRSSDYGRNVTWPASTRALHDKHSGRILNKALSSAGGQCSGGSMAERAVSKWAKSFESGEASAWKERSRSGQDIIAQM